MKTAVVSVALLGTESTGKTQLAQAMAQALTARGHRVLVVAEWLRTWCERAGRTPGPDEQPGIAQEQRARVEAATLALAVGPADKPAWVIADTTPLMTALYSEWLFGDTSLYPMAFAHQHSFGHTLVTGLDLPWVADGLQRDGAHVREPIDALLRQRLAEADVPYKVVYGTSTKRLDNALRAIGLAPSAPSAPASEPGARWVWRCDKCSDPACEHQLFSRLAGGRAAG